MSFLQSCSDFSGNSLKKLIYARLYSLLYSFTFKYLFKTCFLLKTYDFVHILVLISYDSLNRPTQRKRRPRIVLRKQQSLNLLITLFIQPLTQLDALGLCHINRIGHQESVRSSAMFDLLTFWPNPSYYYPHSNVPNKFFLSGLQ